jgi:organic radical activating enzyme
MLTVPIFEIFRSFQGEGKYLGKEMVFVRFAGCNLRCDYCDTPRALDAQAGSVYTENQLAWEIKRHLGRANYVSFTGGEPTLYAAMIARVRELLPSRIQFFLETNGTLPEKLKICAPAITVFSIDLKGAQDKNFIECVKIVRKQPQADVYAKIVLTTKVNPERVVKILKKAGITELFVQPEFGRIPKRHEIDKLIYTLEAQGIRCWLVPQLHKLLKVH